MNIAVIDLGTNTFNCCVVALSSDNFTKLLEFQEYPRIGEKGIALGYIAEEAFQRGLEALKKIKERISPFNCEKIKLFGTSALRNARNAVLFCEKAKQLFDFDITIISGEDEANFIFLGNSLAFNWKGKTALILDIGGGSNECIICQPDKILWKHSFECGMQRVVAKFGLTHPLEPSTIKNINNYLEDQFSLLSQVIQQYKIDLFIGSAGAFDVFRSIYYSTSGIENPKYSATEIPLNDFRYIVDYLKNHTLIEIENMPGMDIPRAPLLSIAGCIADFMISKYNLTTIIASSYSLKEGVIHSLML